MRFISFKFLNPPVIAPVEYSYQAEAENTIGDVVRVRCEEHPVPELIMAFRNLSRPVLVKMLGQDVANASEPFHFALCGMELREASDKKSWSEEAAFHLLLGLRGQEDKIKTPFYGLFDTYQGRRVIVDDGCPVADGVYTTYLFGNGAIAYGNGSPVGFVPTEIDRDKRKGSGVDYLINRKTFILHPRGIKFTGAVRANQETVSRAELANAKNWQRVYEPKAIRMVAFKHKI